MISPKDKKEVRQVYKTKDYQAFKFITGNRPVIKTHLAKLILSMKEEYIPVPIIVNEYLEIIDGQHRYFACKELDLDMHYIQIQGLRLKDVQRLNELMKAWTADAFMNCYCDLALDSDSGEYDDYVEYSEFKREYGYGHNETQTMLAGKTMFSGKLSDDFRKGEFKIDNIKKAKQIANQIREVSEYYSGYKRRGFVIAIMKCLSNPEYDHKRFIAKLSYQTDKLTDFRHWQQYLTVIQDIYNYYAKEEDKVMLMSL